MTAPGEALPELDRARITAIVRAYATAIDLGDLELLRSVVTDPVFIDFTSYAPERTAAWLSFDEWVDGLRPQVLGLDASLHTVSDPCITLLGEGRATSVCAVRAEHFLAERLDNPVYTIYGHYTDTLVCQDTRWSITAKVLTVQATAGDRELMAVARRRGARRLPA
jgi:SnoaL-like domain